MFYFFDTSALVKRYRQEIGTDTIDKIFAETANTLIICSISICEVVQAIDKHFQRKEIGFEDFHNVINRFYYDLSNERIAIIEINQKTLFKANDFIIKYHLSTNDAIILASCYILQDIIFVCADVRSGLIKAACECHISTLNPLSS